ncbi:MAG TPA: peroxiredoxin [Opitutaceae bacterium]|nr:peroxiredoxin [Opitutaceae bacterium]
MKLRFLFALPLVFAAFSAAKAEPIDLGADLPAVTGTTETGEPLDFATLRKGYTFVYFFPRAFTPGCTAQGCSLRDSYDKLRQRGVTVIGVSTDPASKEKSFKEKEHFPFTLVGDPDQKIIGAFGVPTRGTGSDAIAIRQAYLFKDGKLVWRDLRAKTTMQADDLIKALDAQQAGQKS